MYIDNHAPSRNDRSTLMRLACVVNGQGRLLQTLLNARAHNLLPFELALVASPAPCGATARARAAGVPTHEGSGAPGLFHTELEGLVERAGAEFVLLNYNRLLPPTVVGSLDARIVNVHFSLLPAFAGLNAMDRALAAGVPETGVTIHFVDEGVDTGPVISQAVVPVQEGRPFIDTRRDVFKAAVPLQLQTLAWLAQGRVTLAPKRRTVTVSGAMNNGSPFRPALEAPWKKLPEVVWEGVWPEGGR